jgi:DMSO/TMAO reductase YedYZ molybdopterin-dependent catalytic subunit
VRSKAGVRIASYNVGMHDRAIGRAAFLGLVGAGVAGLFVGRDAMDLLGRIVPDHVQAIVPTSGWRIYTIGSSLPRIDPAAYRLTVSGAVERPVTYTLADLRALPRAEQVSDFHCVTGWRVEDVHWGGVQFRDVLAEARLRPEAKTLRFVSAEVPYDDTLTLPQALAADVMLALDMDGGPLSEGHGFPARVVMPRMYGYKSVKWVTRIEVETTFDRIGYWEQRGYDKDAWIGASNGY